MFYLLDKPKAVSSFQAISDFAKNYQILKIGHSGTLDPLATGALLVATDDDTKLLSYLANTNKTYFVTFKIGYTSDTYDCQGVLQKSNNLNLHLSFNQVKQTVLSFQGSYQQMPPPFSAKKIAGQRAYLLARRGTSFQLRPTWVQILKISNLTKIHSDTYAFKVEVTAGTYIRSLVHDIGLKLQTGAIMTRLRRIKIGDLHLQKAVQKIDPLQIINLDKIIISKVDIVILLQGKTKHVEKTDGTFLLIYNHNIVGVGQVKNQVLKSQKLFGKKIEKILC